SATATYNGGAQWLSDFTGSWITAIHQDTTMVTESTVTYKGLADTSFVPVAGGKADIIDVGEYQITLQLTDKAKNNYTWADGTDGTKTFKLTMGKKKIDMYPPEVDEYGDFIAGYGFQYVDLTMPYTRDRGTNREPDFELEYKKSGSSTWTTTKPTVAGNYSARPTITNPLTCNYEINYSVNCEKSFTRQKTPVAVPYFWNGSLTTANVSGSTTTVEYSGDWQDFNLINNAAANTLDDVTVGRLTGGLMYDNSTDLFSAKQVGDYGATVTLADGGANTRWADSDTNPSTTRTVLLKVTKKKLTVAFEDDTITSWQLGARTDIKAKVSGVIPGDAVQLKVTYKDGDGNSTQLPPSAIVASGSDIDITVDLTTFSANQSYELNVELQSGVAVNNNYVLDPQKSTFDFFILKATITELDIEWKYENAIEGLGAASDTEHITPTTGNATLVATKDMPYNGQAYTMSLNEAKLPGGLIITYSDEVQTNVRTTANGGPTYTTTATLSVDPNGGYEIDGALAAQTYQLIWKILPQEVDLTTLTWAPDPEYDAGKSVYMYLLDLPAGTFKKSTDSTIAPYCKTDYTDDGWIIVDQLTSFTKSNKEKDVGTGYTAGYLLKCDDNHTFKDLPGHPRAQEGADGITVLSEVTAEVSHLWNIIPTRIKTSVIDDDWSTSLNYYDTEYDHYSVPQSNALADYPNVLQVTYYATQTDAENGTNEIDVSTIDVIPGQLDTYYIRLEIKPALTGNYELFDTVFTQVKDYLVKPFQVGDERTVVDVDYGDSVYVYDGTVQGPDPTIDRDMVLTVTYYNISDDSVLSGKPTDIGDYYVIVAFEDEDYDDDYRLTPSRFNFSIVPLELKIETTDWANNGGNIAPTEHVSADTQYRGGNDYSELYDYTVYEIVDGVRQTTPADKNNLKYDTDYVAVLTIASGFEDNVKFADGAAYEHEFHTQKDPAAETNELPLPTLSDLIFNGNEFNVMDYVPADYVGKVKIEVFEYTPNVDGQTSDQDADGNYIVKNAGTYSVRFTLLDSDHTTWADGTTDKLEAEWKVLPLEIERPELNGFVYTGEVIDFEAGLAPEYGDWVTVTVEGYTPNIEGTTSVDEEGNYVVLRAGTYALKFVLVDTQNTKWKDKAEEPEPEPNESVAHRVSLLADGTANGTEDITLDLVVGKAQIKGTWNEDGSFAPENAEDEGKYEIVYIDENGNEAKFGEFEDGVSYRAIATLNGEYLNDYEFAEDLRFEEDPATSQLQFTATASFA
ncbi:MAG: hypothetical protein K2N74_06400, partial [Clostridiales bacterium]|nr:hypothetical protein [Clostridiales bacterium]